MKSVRWAWGLALAGITGGASVVSMGADAVSETLAVQMGEAAVQEPASAPLAAGPKELSFQLPAAGRSLSVVSRLGEAKAAWSLSVGDAATLTLVSSGEAPPLSEVAGLGDCSATGKNSAAFALLSSADTYMTVKFFLSGKNTVMLPYFLKPNLSYYVVSERDGVASRYPQFPSALTHAFTVRLERVENGLQLWLDGRFLGVVPASGNLTSGKLILSKGNEVLSAFESQALRSGCCLPLDLAPYSRPGTCEFISEISTMKASAMGMVDGIPMISLSSRRNIDVGLSRWLEEGAGADYCDNDTTRNAFTGCPESIVLQVPKENYIAAHLLCAVEPSKSKVPVLSLRVTRFGRHYGDSGGRSDEAFADATVVLPGSQSDALPGNVRKVGEVTVAGTADGVAERRLPVYLVTIPLALGTIADLLGGDAPDFGRGDQYLDMELTKEIRQMDTRRKPSGAPSAAHVFAMTLERATVDVQMVSKEPGNIFTAPESPELSVRLTNALDTQTDLELSWEAVSFAGEKMRKSTTVAVPAKMENGGVAVERILLGQSTLGYFDAVITVREARGGREIWRQPTSFALLPPDTRKAGAESPFGAWWFRGIHGTCDKVDVMGPILMKLGMRHVCPSVYKYAGRDLAPYKLSCSMVPWYGMEKEGNIDTFIQENPGVRFGMIFHENGISDTEEFFPYPELLGKPKPELTGKGKAELEELWRKGVERGRLYRSKYPTLKITAGNTHSPLIVQLMRHGFPKEYIDCFGMEGVSGWTTTECQPEHSVTQEVWWIREIQRLYGYDGIPVSSGFEYITRGTQRGSGLTERGQSDLYIRDALHCLAYGYPSINIGSAEDFSDSYNATVYGGAGFVRRNPLLTPKPSYVAWATMTRLLDCAAYTRYLETGSRSLYVLEFKSENGYVYPIWTIRGRRALTAALDGPSEVSLTDGMGNCVNLVPREGGVSVEATTSPMYLVATRRIVRITPGAAAYEERPPADPVAAADFSDPSAWEMEEKGAGISLGCNPSVPGKFTLTSVEDAERGRVAELTLEPQPDAAKICARFATLKLKAPAVIDREVKRIGVWLRGNSCWGAVGCEFVDAKGERYATVNELHWDRNRWHDSTGINFDGWCFISFGLPRRGPGGQPGRYDHNWRHSGGDNDGVPQFPITVTRVAVALRDWQVYVTAMVPSQSRSIRLGSILAGE